MFGHLIFDNKMIGVKLKKHVVINAESRYTNKMCKNLRNMERILNFELLRKMRKEHVTCMKYRNRMSITDCKEKNL